MVTIFTVTFTGVGTVSIELMDHHN